MARKKSDIDADAELQNELQEESKRKYKLKGLLVWGSIVYSNEGEGEFPITDEIAENLLSIRPELINLFE